MSLAAIEVPSFSSAQAADCVPDSEAVRPGSSHAASL